MSLLEALEKIKERLDILRSEPLARQESNNEEIVEVEDNSKKIFIIVPMGIPAMGKSFVKEIFKAAFEAKGSTFSVISSDIVRAECMKNYMKTSGNYDKENAFIKSNKSAKKLFNKLISKEMETKTQNHAIFLDKNHPPNSVPRLLEEINKYTHMKSSIKFIALVPEISKPLIIKDAKRDATYTYEISLSFINQCLLRIKNRHEHETLTGSLTHKTQVLLMMLNMYRDVHFDDYLDKGFNHILRIPFTEEEHFDVDEGLKENLSDALLRFNPDGLPNEHIVRDVVSSIENSLTIPPKVDAKPRIVAEVEKLFKKNYKKIEEETKEIHSKIVKEESKIVPIKKNKAKSHKLPTYIGVDVDKYLKPILIPHILSFLRELHTLYQDESILDDLQEISTAILPGVCADNFSKK